MPAPGRAVTPKMGKRVMVEPGLLETATIMQPPPTFSPSPPDTEAARLRSELASHQKKLEVMISDLVHKLPQIIADALRDSKTWQAPAKPHTRRDSSASAFSRQESSGNLPGLVPDDDELPFAPHESLISDQLAAKRAKVHLQGTHGAQAAKVTTSASMRPMQSIRQMFLGRRDSSEGAGISKRMSLKRPEKRKVSGVKEHVEKRIEARKSLEFVDESWFGKLQQSARRVVEAPVFEWVCGVLILLCAVLIGVEAEWTMQNIGTATPLVFRVLNTSFNAAFGIELCLRWLVEGLSFFSWNNQSLHWNTLDLALILFAIVEEVILLLFASAASGVDLSMLRTLRMLRLARVLRILKVVRFFAELRIMVNGVMGSAKSLFWALLLIMLVNFLFGVFFMQFSLNYLETTDSQAELLAYFGSLSRTMMTLYQAISGGIDWGTAVATLLPVSYWMEYVFSAYVFFTVFCCLNIITGIFVDNAKALKVADEENMHHEAMRERQKWVAQVAELFSRLDADNTGTVTKQDFETTLANSERVTTCFEKLGINTDATDTDELWQLFDLGANGAIDQDDFAIAIKQYHGQARSIDLFVLRKEVRQISKLVQKLTAKTVNVRNSAV
mmetsp:Transcript_58298/g.130191  ORF Transcript_58298/g.130191 Transcript_58298/m.130191 type:complete len:614 (-) Transcript_58298:41-1882(-)